MLVKLFLCRQEEGEDEDERCFHRDRQTQQSDVEGVRSEEVEDEVGEGIVISVLPDLVREVVNETISDIVLRYYHLPNKHLITVFNIQLHRTQVGEPHHTKTTPTNCDSTNHITTVSVVLPTSPWERGCDWST